MTQHFDIAGSLVVKTEFFGLNKSYFICGCNSSKAFELLSGSMKYNFIVYHFVVLMWWSFFQIYSRLVHFHIIVFHWFDGISVAIIYGKGYSCQYNMPNSNLWKYKIGA